MGTRQREATKARSRTSKPGHHAEAAIRRKRGE
jgi:hypothetical protein